MHDRGVFEDSSHHSQSIADRFGVHAVNDLGVVQLKPLFELQGMFGVIYRCTDYLDVQILEDASLSVEVNQLLTTIWSPVASIEVDYAPGSCRKFGERNLLVV